MIRVKVHGWPSFNKYWNLISAYSSSRAAPRGIHSLKLEIDLAEDFLANFSTLFFSTDLEFLLLLRIVVVTTVCVANLRTFLIFS